MLVADNVLDFRYRLEESNSLAREMRQSFRDV